MHPSPRVDPTVLDQLQALGGDALVKRLATLFLESSKNYVSDITEGLEVGDMKRVETAAHTLKSGAGSLGARSVCDLAEELECAARSEKIETLQQLGDELADVYGKTCEDLVELIQE